MRNVNVGNHKSQRFLTFYNTTNGKGDGNGQNNNNNLIMMGNPAYTIFGEDCAFSVKAILPEFRSTKPNGEGMIVVDSSKRGRLLFEWTPLNTNTTTTTSSSSSSFKKYRWDSTTRFALSAEEAGSILARLDRGDESIEFTRRMGNNNNNDYNNNSFQNTTGKNLDKLFCVKPIEIEIENSGGVKKNDGISLLVDYIDSDSGRLGQIPHPPSDHDGMRGPFEIQLMIGEFYVLRSIIEHSIPKLIGWSTMFDRNNEQAVLKSVRGGGSGNYNNNYNNNNRGGGSGSSSGGGSSGGFGNSSPHNYFSDDRN